MAVETFKIINAEWKAYFLGLMYADGCIRDKYKAVIFLQDKDQELIKELSKKIFKYEKINNRKSRQFISTNGKTYTSKSQSGFVIYGKDRIQNIVNLGCTPRKTLTLKFPTYKQIPKKYIWHFIRGYFDGDGTVSDPTTKSKIEVKILSTNAFLIMLQFKLNKIGICSRIINRGNVDSLEITGKENCLKFGKLIYTKAKTFLMRKKQRFINWENHYIKSHSCNKSSKIRNITYHKTSNSWHTRKTINGKRIGLGYFKTEKQAIRALPKVKKYIK